MRAPRRHSLTALVVTLGLMVSLMGSHAQAHAKLVSADPAPNTTVAAPKLIRLQFSEELAKEFSSLRVTDTDGNPVAMVAKGSKDPKTLEAMPTGTLSPGVYTVSWTSVATDDGHKMTGHYSFTVK